MSTPQQQQLDQHELASEIAGLKRAVAKLLKRLEQPTGGSDLTVDQFCAKHNMSRAGFYKMRKAGRGPRTITNNGLVRIPAAADAEWESKYSSAEFTAVTDQTEVSG